MQRNLRIGLAFGIIILCLFGMGYVLMHSKGSLPTIAKTTGSGTAKIQIVAGENFWGSIASQIGGSDVTVLSIVSDPNVDPHEYETNATDARAFAEANYVILNGAGYDAWGEKLLAGSTDPSRKTLIVATLLGKKDGDNPHFWYNPAYVNTVAKQVEMDLISLDPAHTLDYEKNYMNLQNAMADYQNRIQDIRAQYSGTSVASTESIFVYLAQATGLNLISPTPFINAISEGNDPPAESIGTFQDQLKSGHVSVLVYNEQTVTPLTESMKALALQEHIPTIGVTETIQPPTETFEAWMDSQIVLLQNALSAQK